MSDVGSADWQRGVASTVRPVVLAMTVTGGSSLLTVGGNGVVVWNLDIVPTSSTTGGMNVTASVSLYVFASSDGPMADHWISARGCYLTPGQQLEIVVNDAFNGQVTVSMLYDQL